MAHFARLLAPTEWYRPSISSIEDAKNRQAHEQGKRAHLAWLVRTGTAGTCLSRPFSVLRGALCDDAKRGYSPVIVKVCHEM
jgi:hypothetical protein